MRRILLALALVAMATSAASAATTVWWEMVGSNCGATSTGGSGQTLVIEKPLVAPAGFYEFELVMKASADAAASTQGMTGYRSTLWMPPADVGIKTLTAAVVDNPFNWTPAPVLNINVGQRLFDNSGRARGTGQQPLYAGNSPQILMHITLKINVPTEPFCEEEFIYQTVGLGLFGYAPLGQNTVKFGPNNFVPGGTAVDTWAGASATLPVIRIHAIPEPATLALLGFGFLALLRRR